MPSACSSGLRCRYAWRTLRKLRAVGPPSAISARGPGGGHSAKRASYSGVPPSLACFGKSTRPPWSEPGPRKARPTDFRAPPQPSIIPRPQWAVAGSGCALLRWSAATGASALREGRKAPRVAESVLARPYVRGGFTRTASPQTRPVTTPLDAPLGPARMAALRRERSVSTRLVRCAAYALAPTDCDHSACQTCSASCASLPCFIARRPPGALRPFATPRPSR